MVDESEPTDYNICQNLWRNVPRNAMYTEHRRDLYCIFAKLVKQNNIDLENVEGTGPEGRIIKRDIINLKSREEAVTILFTTIYYL